MIASFQPLQWHTSKAFQNYRSCGDAYIPCFPVNDPPNVQINASLSALPTIVNVSTGQTSGIRPITETCEIKGESITFTTFENDTYLTGKYYYTATVDGQVYYSDVFQLKNEDCFCFKIEWSHCTYNGIACYDGVFSNALYFTEVTFAAPTYEKIVEGKENGNNQFVASYTRLESYTNLQVMTVCHVNNALQSMAFHDSIVLTDLKTNTEIQLQEVSVTDPTEECYFLTTLTYKEAELESNSCCDEENDFEDNCITEPSNPACNNWDIDINVNGDILELNITGTPPNGTGPLITWSKNGSQLSGTNSIDTQGLPGTYCVRVVYPDCPAKTLCHEILDPCENFNVTINCVGLTIDGIVTGNVSTPIITILDSNGQTVGTSFPTTVTDPGSYIIKVISSPCEFITTKTLAEGACEIDFNIVKTPNDQLTAENVTGCDDNTIIYQWYKQIDDLITPISNNVAITPDESANYILQISCGGCISPRKSYTCIIQEDKIKVEICNDQDNPIHVTGLEVNPVINVNVYCGECDDECNGTLTVRCIKNEDGTVDMCSEFTSPGYSFTVCDSNGNQIGTGDKVSIPPNISETYTIKGEKEGCPNIQATYPYTAPNAGTTGNDQNNPQIVQ